MTGITGTTQTTRTRIRITQHADKDSKYKLSKQTDVISTNRIPIPDSLANYGWAGRGPTGTSSFEPCWCHLAMSLR